MRLHLLEVRRAVAPAEKAAVAAFVERCLADGTVIRDVESLELLEWSFWDVASERQVAEALGPLRLRLVRALPKDQAVGTRCLEACLAQWDLVSAQQIAAILDRSFPAVRRFMF